MISNDELMEKLNSFYLPTISEQTKFWMIRTQKGYFFDEFVQNEFIALAWNTIDKRNLHDNQDELREKLKEDFPEYKKSGMIISKCKSFIDEMKNGDIVIIPNSGKSNIAIAIVGEYYEDKSKNLDIEKEITSIIKAEGTVVKQLICPYKKRRHMQLLRIVNPTQISHHLLLAMTSYHGITNLNDYAHDILRLIFNMYAYKNDISIVYNVGQEGPISPRALSEVLYGTTSFYSKLIDENNISTKVNLNSIGDIVIFLNDCKNYLVDNYLIFLALFGVATGFTIKGVSWPGIPDFLKKVLTLKSDVNAHKKENKIKELDYDLKAMEVIKKSRELGFDTSELEKDLGLINKSIIPLQIKPIEENYIPIADAFDNLKQNDENNK